MRAIPYLMPIMAISFLISFAAVPVVRRLARDVGAIDVPRGPLQIHDRPTPRLGGVAIFIGFLLTTVLAVCLSGLLSDEKKLFLLPIFLGAAMMLGLGVIDDIRGVQPEHRFFVQIPAAILLIIFGVKINMPFALPVGLALTVCYVVGACNSLNLLDGLDGLAAGITVIAAVAFGAVFVIQGDALGVVLSATLAGSALGFLWHNFHPASIFMGDSGSLFLGFMLAVLAIRYLRAPNGPMNYLVPLAILGVPILDTGLTVLRRVIHRRPLLPGDREHSYDKLMAGGFTKRQTVFAMYGTSAVFAGTGILLTTVMVLPALIIGIGELAGLAILVRKYGMLRC